MIDFGSIRILFVEDMPSDRELAVHVIEREGLDFTWRQVETEKDFLYELEDFQPDIVISDYSMPEFDGMRALELSLQRNPTLPFIILTGTLNEETAVKCIKAGATDYVIKERITRLPFAVKEAITQHMALKQREAAEKALLESEERFSRAFHSSPACLVITQLKDGKIIDINEAYCKMLGYRREELINHFTEELQIWANAREREMAFHEFASKGRIQNREVLFRNRDKEILTVIASVEPIDINGQKCIINSAVDISARKKAEENLIAAKIKAEESDKLKSAFLANMSHEIRTPMNGILGFLDLLNEQDLSEENKAEYIEMVNISAKRMLDTVNDIIEVSRIESGEVCLKISPVDIFETMNYVFDFYKQQADYAGLDFRVEKQIMGKGPIITSDGRKLEAILMNLVKNAIKYTPGGKIEIGNYLAEDSLVFYVRDTGIGIPANRLEAIFDRFVQADLLSYSRPYEGSGLGLSIAKAYTELLGGKIGVESEEGRGSLFYFSIPYNPVAQKNSEDNSSYTLEQDDLSGLKVLIAEDDDINFHYLNIVLTNAGADIIRAVNGVQCIAKAKEFSDISLIIMDIKMPEMNGFEATKKIRMFNDNIPIIAFTAFAFPDDRETALNAGCNDYLAKPVSSDEIICLISNYSKK